MTDPGIATANETAMICTRPDAVSMANVGSIKAPTDTATARIVTTRIASATAAKVVGSVGETPNSSARSSQFDVVCAAEKTSSAATCAGSR